MRRLAILSAAALIVACLASCTAFDVRTVDNGGAGAETWRLPMPAWPKLATPCGD